MKETYKVKTPKYISVGDPSYFENLNGDELNRLTLAMPIPPHCDAARVIIEEKPCEEMPEYSLLDMTIYLAPKNTINTYLGGMMYSGEQLAEKIIGVDTAKYKLQIDDKENTIYTGSDGIWGSFTEYYREFKGKRLVTAMSLNLGFSADFDTQETLRNHLNYFFNDVEQIENTHESVLKEDEQNEQKM